MTLDEIRRRIERPMFSPIAVDGGNIGEVFTDFLIDSALAFKDRVYLLRLVERLAQEAADGHGETYENILNGAIAELEGKDGQ